MTKPLYINWDSRDIIKELFPNRHLSEHIYRIWDYNRYIQFAVSNILDLSKVHYELCANGHVELHFEGELDSQLSDLSQFLCSKTQNNSKFSWRERGDYRYGCCRLNDFIDNIQKMKEAVLYMSKTMDCLIEAFIAEAEAVYCDDSFDDSRIRELRHFECQEDVSLWDGLSLEEIMHLTELKIPDYQRIYCWDEKNVIQLLEDVTQTTGKYRIGTLIFHQHEGNLDIIDGQQRLVTLSLILKKLGFEQSPLLRLSFHSSEARRYLAYNRYLIDTFINRHFPVGKYSVAKNILKNIEFSVLVLNSNNMDLAYTFFSNENSKGKPLTDFDLLKAHHLRYVNEEPQAEHLAISWDKMLTEANTLQVDDIEKPYIRALALYVYRLRMWARGETWHDYIPLRVKMEYEAAPVIDEIPAFGESFVFNESIQGGAHFFAFVKQFEHKYNIFAQTAEYKAIHTLSDRTHWWFRDIIETFLFGYYLKFGNEYLSEALVAISRIISQLRYDYKRANYDKMLERANDTGIISMIDRATSPTFVLAELHQSIKNLPSINVNLSGIQIDFRNRLRCCIDGIMNNIVVNRFKSII